MKKLFTIGLAAAVFFSFADCQSKKKTDNTPALVLLALAASNSCRTYVTESSSKITQSGTTSTTTDTCTYSNLTYSCTSKNSAGSTSTTSFTYGSNADFVAEGKIMGLTKAKSASLPSIGSITYTYDSTGRLTSSSSVLGTTTYSGHDASGRYTSSVLSGSTLTFAYNDSTKTTTMSGTSVGGAFTITTTYDSNNNTLKSVSTVGGVATSTTEYTISKVA